MSSSVLGEQTNLGSSAESSKPATPAAGGSGQVLNPQPQKEQGRTTPSGFTSSVPGTSYNSSFEEGNISYGESGNATPRRPASPPPAGAADERQGLAEGALGQASQGDKQRHRPTQGDGASQHSSDSQHQHQQQDQQRKQQQQLMSTSVASLEPSQTPQLPPGLRSGAREPLDPASECCVRGDGADDPAGGCCAHRNGAGDPASECRVCGDGADNPTGGCCAHRDGADDPASERCTHHKSVVGHASCCASHFTWYCELRAAEASWGCHSFLVLLCFVMCPFLLGTESCQPWNNAGSCVKLCLLATEFCCTLKSD